MNTDISKDKLAERLAEDGRLDRRQVRELLDTARKQQKSVFRLLIEKELMKEEEVTEFLSEQLKIPVLPLGALRVPKEVLQLVPRKIAQRYQVLPLGRISNLLTVATSDPFQLMLHDDLKELTRCDVCMVLAAPKMITAALDNYYAESGNFEEVLQGLDAETLEMVHRENEEEGEGAARDKAQEAPIVRMVNLVLAEAIRLRASDIHFEPYEKHFRVRYRIDGALKEVMSHGRELYGSLVARIKIMAQLNITEKRLPQDGRFRVNIQDREIDLRVSILPIYYGEKIVLRVLDKSGVKSGLSKLGFSEKPTAAFAEAIKHPYGMVLVTGPTGSGKSTTLYTILSTLNTPEKNIMTIEDPVEYQVEGITQTQVHAEVGLTFASGLRSLLRQSPDIVLVGEIRDRETADIAVKAALTGHLVFSTLHTNSAAGAVTRLIDMGVEPFLISSSVICVAAQRLVRRICDSCKESCEIPSEILRRCALKPSEMEGIKAFKGKGCAKCNQTGYYGRLGAIEVLKLDVGIRTLVVQRKSSDVIEKVAVEKGMETLFQNAFGLFKQGLTTLEEVLRVSSQG